MVELKDWRRSRAADLDSHGVSAAEVADIQKRAERVADYERQIKGIEDRLRTGTRRRFGEEVRLLPSQIERLREERGYLVPRLAKGLDHIVSSPLPRR